MVVCFHNNCGLALANSITAMVPNCSTVDTTLLATVLVTLKRILLLAYDNRKRKAIKGYDTNNFIEIMNKA